MTPMTISPAAVAPVNIVAAHEPGISTPLSVVAWLSMAAVVLSLMIGAAFSLIIWSVAG
jgi:hypothetical protein